MEGRYGGRWGERTAGRVPAARGRPGEFGHVRPALLAAAVIFATWVTSSRAGQPEVDRFRSEYPKAGEQLETAYGQVRGLVYVTQFGQNDKTPHESTRFAVDGGRRKFEFVDVAHPEVRGGRPSHVHCSSDRSTFELTWSPKESAYIVESLAKGQDEATKLPFQASVGRFLSLPYAIGGRPIRGLLDRPSTKVVDAHELVKDGRTLVRVDLELRPGP